MYLAYKESQKKTKDKDANRTTRYIVDFTGTSITAKRASRIRSYARSIWKDQIKTGKLLRQWGGKNPSWGDVGEEAKSEYVALMEQEFPFLRMGEDHWKSHEMGQDNFSYAMSSLAEELEETGIRGIKRSPEDDLDEGLGTKRVKVEMLTSASTSTNKGSEAFPFDSSANIQRLSSVGSRICFHTRNTPAGASLCCKRVRI